MASNDEAVVGYGSAPVDRRFKQGTSGNPKGRPKGRKNLKTELQEELAEPIRVCEGTHEQVVSKQRAVVKVLVAAAVAGDMKAAMSVLALSARILGVGEATDEIGLSVFDERAANDYIEREVTRRLSARRIAEEAKS